MSVKLQRPCLVVTLVGAIAATVQILFLLLIFGPPWPVLMMLSHGAQFLPMLGALLMIILAWIAGWQASRFPIILSGMIWIAAIAWLMTHRTAPWPDPQMAALGDRGVIRIVTFNAWFANHDPEGAARWILKQRPEAIVLQEVGWRSRVLLTQIALQYPYVVTCRGSRPCSTVMLSRRKPLDMRGLAHGDADNRHALSAAIMRFPEYALVGVHLSQPWPMGAHRRELRWLASELRGVPRHRLVVAGDFNATGWSMTMRDVASMLGLRTLPPDRASWPAPSSGLLLPAVLDIDHALLGPGWVAAQFERGPDLGSDHYPFMITLNLN